MLGQTYSFFSNSNPDNGATITNYTWDFGDSTFDNSQNPVHTYTNPGNYWVCLNITTSSGCTNSICGYINVSGTTPCQAGFYSYLDSITVPPISPYIFVDQSTLDSSSIITSWNWTFQGGNPATSTLQNPSVTFVNSGYHLACLTIVTSNGCTSSYCDSVFVQNGCLLAVTPFSQNPTTIGASDGYIETTISGGTPPYSILWSTGQTSSNIYNLTSGNYTLNVIDANGCNYASPFSLYEPYDTIGGPIVDTLTTNIIDSCLNFIPDSFYISSLAIDSIHNIVTATWTFISGGSIANIIADYNYYYSGNNAIQLTINCGTKTLVTYMSYINITASVGINEIGSEKSELFAYPVPFNDKLTILFSSNTSGNGNISLWDATGRNLTMKNIVIISGNNSFEMNTSLLLPGIYILKIEYSGSNFYKQIIK
jgi:PKD repeat protein